MIETVIVGFTVLLVVVPTLLLIARMTEASDAVHAEARAVAVWVARHGVVPETGHDMDTRVTIDADVVHVEASIGVDVLSIGGSTVGTTVSAEFSIPISEYRSDR